MNQCSDEVPDYFNQSIPECDRIHVNMQTAKISKAQLLFDSFMQQSFIVSQIVKDIPGFKPKRIFPKRDKSKGKKAWRYQAMYKNMVATRMAHIQRLIIQSQPIPKYGKVGIRDHPGGVSIIEPSKT